MKHEMENAEILYEDFNGKKHSKKIKIPMIRYGMGITKQREGMVLIGYFLKNPKIAGHGKDNYFTIYVPLPKSTEGGTARLKIGKRVVSRAA